MPQFFAPIVALTAAFFAYRSAVASRRAVEASEEANKQDRDERARRLRPTIEVQFAPNASGGMVKCHMILMNARTEAQNLAHNVTCEVWKFAGAEATGEIKRGILGVGEQLQGRLMILPVATPEDDFREIDEGDEEVEFRSRLLMGRVEYSNELGLARWSQQFSIIEYAKGRLGGMT